MFQKNILISISLIAACLAGANVYADNQVQVEVQFVDPGDNFGQDIGIDFNGNEANKDDFGSVEQDFMSRGGEDISRTSPGQFGQTGADDFGGFGSLTGNSLDAAIDAVQESGEQETLSSPKVLQGSSQGNEPVISAAENEGVQLQVTPVVQDDNSIRLDVTPQVGDPDASSSRQITLPEIQTREAGTQVTVRDGETMVLGGLQSTNTTETSKVPMLSKVPVIGGLFKSDSDEARNQELVIITKPQLVNPAE